MEHLTYKGVYGCSEGDSLPKEASCVIDGIITALLSPLNRNDMAS